MNKFEIGDKVSFKECYDDMQESDIEDWHGAIVLEVSEKTIKIQRRHSSRQTTKYIDKNAKTLQCHNQLVQYNDLPIVAKGSIPPYPVYHYDKSNEQKFIIITIPTDEENPGIYSYNVDTTEYKKISSYPNDFYPEQTGLAIDSNNNELYIFAGRSKCFATYNILNDTFNIHNKTDIIPAFCYPTSLYAASTNELYFEGLTKDGGRFVIMKYSQKNGSFTQITTNFSNKEMKYSRMMYDENKERIMLLGGWTRQSIDANIIYYDDIWVYDIHQSDYEGKWELYPLKMPHKAYAKHALFAFDSIVIVIYCEKAQNEIWCLELMSSKWFKSHLCFPRELAQCDVILVDDYNVHCMNYSDIHGRIDLHDVIPQELFEFYSEYYLNLICGYIRITFEEQWSIHMSFDLKQLISKYFNVFL